MEEIIISVLVFVVSTLMTYILGLLSKKHKWNEKLPIPVQNCLVGIIVFILACVFCLVFKKTIEPVIIVQQIALAMGGAGTATLGYDLQKIDKE